jgi:hypothetical protein
MQALSSGINKNVVQLFKSEGKVILRLRRKKNFIP